MIRGLYSAASALQAAEVNHDVVAENLAHATMPGYRRQVAVFGNFANALNQASAGAANTSPNLSGTDTPTVQTDFRPGSLEHTGNTLDVAAIGNAFFVVDGPEGPLLTKNGTFQLNALGQLQTSGGQQVQGEGGPITIPSRTTNIVIGNDGRVLADNQPVGQLRLAQVDNPAQLQRVGTTFFRGANTNTRPRPGTVRVEQGYRETSNVQAVDEVVSMMLGLRHYEAAQRMKVLADAVSLNTQPNS